MKKKCKISICFIIGLVILSIISISGCVEKYIKVGSGVIKFIEIEGGFYGIFSDDGEKYDPLNLPDEFKHDGLKVNFKLRVVRNQMSFHMWGKLVYLLDIEIIDAQGILINHTDCKESFDEESPQNLDCIEYNYDGEDILLLTHINAGFNCCPELTADITISDNIITIEEIELSGDCDCLCLFDVFYEISDLSPGEYIITVDEPYLQDDEEKLEFTIDLLSPISGSYCVERFHYPWTD
jgi:hypothetical protein